METEASKSELDKLDKKKNVQNESSQRMTEEQARCHGTRDAPSHASISEVSSAHPA